MEGSGPSIIDLVRVAGLATAIAVLFATWLAVRFVTGTLQGIGNRITERRLQLYQLATISRFVIYLAGIAVAVALSFNLSQDVLLAIGGTAAVTIGFALKDLAASVLAGVIIIVDRPFQVGDRVTFEGYYGEITEIGLRSVRLVTLDDNVVTVPNNKFLTEITSSGNWGALDMQIQMDFYIAPNQDLALSTRIVEEAIQHTRFAYIHKPWVIRVNQVLIEQHVAIRLRAKVYVLDVKYEKELETDVTERVLEGFMQHGIRMPVHGPDAQAA